MDFGIKQCMSSFDRFFSLIAGISLAAWLVAVVPAALSYARAFGDLSVENTKRTAITLVTIAGFTIFWGLVAILARLLLSDWRAAGRQPGQSDG